MTSPIGNSKGITLIEVMVTVSILAVGILVVSQANMAALNAYSRYARRLTIRGWAEERIWQAKEEIFQSEVPETKKISGQAHEDNKTFNWELDVEPDEVEDFYSIDLKARWREGGTPQTLSQASFLQKMKKP